MSEPLTKENNLALNLLSYVDPVVWAKDALGFEADPWQAKFLKCNSKRIILNCSRQSGKSTCAAIIALWEAIHKPKSLIVLDSPSLRQSQELMIKFSGFLNDLYLNKSLSDISLDSDTKLSAEFSNGSRVLALPGSEKTIRGLSAVTLIILDEAARISDDLYKSVRPMLAVSGGRLVLISTPFGQEGFFYEVWQHGGPDWKKVEIKASMCPRISAEFLEEERRSLGEMWYRQEYECDFTSLADARIRREWLKYADRLPAWSEEDIKISIGVDLAISEKETADYTAIVVLGRHKSGQLWVLDADRIRTSFSAQIGFIKQFAEKWKPKVIAVEDIAYQRAMIQTLNAQTALNILPVRPDKDKVSRFAPLEARYEQGQITHLRSLPLEFESELLSFPVGLHDDWIDAMSAAFIGLANEPVKLSFNSIKATRKYNLSSIGAL